MVKQIYIREIKWHYFRPLEDPTSLYEILRHVKLTILKNRYLATL